VLIAAAKLRIVEDGLVAILHDPLCYEKREVGQYALLNEIPEPGWDT
jgi:hypothetical protein